MNNIILGFLAGLGFVAVSVIFLLGIFFGLNKIEGLRKIRFNWIYIAILFVITLGIHCYCFIIINPNYSGDFWYCLFIGFKELFKQLGGLTFEGQEEIGTNLILVENLYIGSTAVLAITNAILIVIGFNYTAYSYIAKMVSFQKNIYIFTYATEESLILADSIKYHHKKDKKCLIIFSSDEIGPFDKTNEIHHRILQSGYLFIPLSKKPNNEKKQKCFLSRIFKVRCGSKAGLLDFVKKHDVHVFALLNNKEEKGNESKNSDIVFDDIETIKNKLSNKDLEKLRSERVLINYYILSNRDFNFQFYEDWAKDLFGTVNWREASTPFNLNVLNEAIMAGEDLVAKRHETIEDDLILEDEQDKTKFNYSKEGHKTLVVGFGVNGQMAMGHEYIDCIGGKMDDEDKKYIFVPNSYSVTAIDKEMDDLLTSFIKNHPSYAFVDKNGNDKKENDCYRELKAFYKDYDFDEIKKLMAFPEITCVKHSYNDSYFLGVIKDIINGTYDSVIITLGNDERTIECANTIIQSLKQTLPTFKAPQKKVRIYINIRDKDNERRIAWNKEIDSQLFTNFYIYKFGYAKDMYSYNSVIDYRGPALINRTYEEVNGGFYDKDAKKLWEYDYVQNCTLYERKTNCFAYQFRSSYVRFLEKHKLNETLKKDYQAYSDAKEKAEEKVVGDKIYKCFTENNPLFKNGFIDEATKKNIESIFDKDKQCLKSTLQNYMRIKTRLNNEYTTSTEEAGYYWRFLSQVDHIRWCRHTFVYGKAFAKPIIKKDLFNENEGKNEAVGIKYWKNYLKLHPCLLPYSDFTDYSKEAKANFLGYKEEDFDCVVVAAAIEVYE